MKVAKVSWEGHVAMAKFIFLLVIAGLMTANSAEVAHSEVSFIDRSSAIPIHQSYEGDWNHFVGGGVAAFDCNDDGFPDLYVAGGSAPSRLFINTSTRGGPITFKQGEIESLTDVIGAYPMDIDGDGILDLVVLRDGGNVVFKGLGGCKFVRAPSDWRFTEGNEWTTSFSATFEKGENWPTFAIGNYVNEKDPNGPFEACDHNYLIRPKGRAFGERIPLDPGFCALSMLFSDWKRVGTPDLRISNDRQYYVSKGREQMWRLNPLHEYTEAEGWPTLHIWGMGIASRDLNGDGLPEIVLTSMADQLLQINLGGGKMKAAPYSMGAYATTPYKGDDGRPSTGWHAEFGDIDNDGRDDLFIAKGNVDQMPSNAIHDPNNLLMQQPDGTFVEKGGVAGIGTTERSRGAAVTDLNLDGKLDIVVVNRRAQMEVWQNSTEPSGHYISVDLREPDANSHAVGAIAEVRLPDGRILTQEHTVGGGHASGDAGPLHFGLGAAASVEIRVTWPWGKPSDWTRIAADHAVRISPGNGSALTVETKE